MVIKHPFSYEFRYRHSENRLFKRKTTLHGVKERVDWLLRSILFVTENSSIAHVSICFELCVSCFSFIAIVLFIKANTVNVNVNACSHETSNVIKIEKIKATNTFLEYVSF